MKALILILLSITLMGCGNDFTSSDSSGIDNGGNNNSSDGDGSIGQDPDDVVTPTLPPGSDLTFSASLGSNSIFGSSEIIRYNSLTNSLEIVMPFSFGGIELAVSGSLPNHPDVTFETSTLDNTLVLSIPISKYLNLSNNVSTLPTGRPLPGIPGGEPPSFGFPISRSGSNAHAYLAPDYIALYAEINLNIPLTFRFPIQSNGQVIGYIHLLSATATAKGGVFFSVQLPRELTALIESIK